MNLISRHRMAVWGTAHAVDDMYQGLVPASVPYFVLERHYSYLAASGLTLAATLGSALPQPAIGLAVDRWRLPRLAAAGVAVAGTGLGLSGLAGPYALVWLCILISGLGVAMFHPAAGRSAREAAGDSGAAMSVFAAGGSVGFFLAPVLATPALDAWGVGATALFVPPAWLIALVLLRNRSGTGRTPATTARGKDSWGPFAALTGIEVVRSAAFFGINTFIELYWLKHLHASRTLAGAALACFLVGGVAGTLLGGRIADRLGMVRTVQLGSALTVPMLVALRVCAGSIAPLAFAVLTGLALNIPFAVLVKLGQDYLPGRPGTAAGVTLGLGVSAGGLMAPVFGLIAEHSGPQGVLTALCAVPVAALVLGSLLREPREVNSPVTVQDLAARLPEPEALRTTCRAFAVLDAAFNTEYPKYLFSAAWRPGVDLARMDNGGGNHWDIVFEPAGVLLHGFDHESEASPWHEDPPEHWPGLLDGLPASLARWTEEEAFQFDEFFEATLCIWRETGDSAWRCGSVEFDGSACSTDGSGWMFSDVVEGGPAGYLEHAESYYEREIDPEAVCAVFAGQPLTAEIVYALNPGADFAAVAKVAETAGYPVARGA